MQQVYLDISLSILDLVGNYKCFNNIVVHVHEVSVKLNISGRRFRKTLRQTQRGSFASLDMVGPTNSRPASNTRTSVGNKNESILITRPYLHNKTYYTLYK